MAWALQLDGVDDYLSAAAWNPTALDFDVEIEFVAGNDTENIIGDAYQTSLYLRRDAGNGETFAWYNGARFYTGAGPILNPIAGQTYAIKFQAFPNGSGKMFFDGVEVASSAAGTLSLRTNNTAPLTIGYTGFAPNSFSDFQVKRLTINDYNDPSNSRNYDATASNHTTGQPVLTDTIGGNDATGINFPTDGSAWIDLGGATSIDVTSQSKTITYTVGQHAVEITGEVNAQSDTKSINYTIGQHTVSLSGEVNATTDTKTISYAIGQHLVELTGEVSTTSDTKTIDYTIGQHTVSLSGDIEVVSQSKQVNYTIGQHDVQLSGEVNAQSDTHTINYSIGQHQVEISGDILALSDTRLINYQIGQHQVTLQGDVDVTTEQKQINYQVGQHSVFIYADEPQKIDSFSMGYKADYLSVAYKTDSFSVQYKD